MPVRLDVAGVVLATETERALSGSGADALCPLGGVPLVAHAVWTLRSSNVVDTVKVLAPPRFGDQIRAALDRFVPGHGAVVVDGSDPGSPPAADAVVVSDCRHPLAPPDLVHEVLAGVLGGADMSVPLLPLTETIKELDSDGWVVRTVARESLGHAQSPWAARAEVVTGQWTEVRAGTGPVELAHRVAGCRLVTVPGHPDAFALDTPADLEFASAVLRARAAGSGHPVLAANPG